MASADKFTIHSSLRTPFSVVSESGLVAGIEVPTPEELKDMLGEGMLYVEACEQRKAVMIVDFEGEMPGYGGEVVTAAFLETTTVNAASLMPLLDALPTDASRRGWLVDLRSEACLVLARRIMESTAITKLSWGADGDCKSLMHQRKPMTLNVNPASVVDVQLGFCTVDRRLGLGRMLERVPSDLLRGLPPKQQIDFDKYHSRNQRAMALPLTLRDAAYAMDDLHRIEQTLRSQAPDSGSYSAAKSQTSRMLQSIKDDKLGVKSLLNEFGWYSKGSGSKKVKKAVELKRHILHIRASAEEAPLTTQDSKRVREIEADVDGTLGRARVVVPDDLAFAAP